MHLKIAFVKISAFVHITFSVQPLFLLRPGRFRQRGVERHQRQMTPHGQFQVSGIIDRQRYHVSGLDCNKAAASPHQLHYGA
jgi:hypothetical protein